MPPLTRNRSRDDWLDKVIPRPCCPEPVSLISAPAIDLPRVQSRKLSHIHRKLRSHFWRISSLPYVGDKNNHMKRARLVIVIWFVLAHVGFGQDEKTEVAVFAGGYFDSGFQSFKVLDPTTGAPVGTFKPVSEANSGIFGVRSSYNFRPQMAAEATFGFSPAGPEPKLSGVQSRACSWRTGNTCCSPLAGIPGRKCVSVPDGRQMRRGIRPQTEINSKCCRYFLSNWARQNALAKKFGRYTKGTKRSRRSHKSLFVLLCSSLSLCGRSPFCWAKPRQNRCKYDALRKMPRFVVK